MLTENPAIDMNFLDYEFDAGPHNVIKIAFDQPANFELMDELNYINFKAGKRYSYLGGFASESPLSIRPPQTGHWHLIVKGNGTHEPPPVFVNII